MTSIVDNDHVRPLESGTENVSRVMMMRDDEG